MEKVIFYAKLHMFALKRYVCRIVSKEFFEKICDCESFDCRLGVTLFCECVKKYA